MATRSIRVARRPRIGIAVFACAFTLALALALVVLQARSLRTPSSGAGMATGSALTAETLWPVSSGIDHPGAYRGGHYVGGTIGSGIDHPGVYRGGHLVAGAEPTGRIGHRPVNQDAPGK